jgi:perosamine synthetase
MDRARLPGRRPRSDMRTSASRTAVAQRSGAILDGSNYERRFADSLGTGVSAFAFWKGRVALYAILRAIGIGPGDEVIVPGFTCVVVPTAVRLTGATAIFADIEPDGFNLDPESVRSRLTPRTKAILVQHTFGIPAALDSFTRLASSQGLRVIEDCAHTVAGTHAGRRLGTVGAAGFFSSQWSKPYTTGLGGMAVTTDPQLALRLHQVQASFREPPVAARLRLSAQFHLYRRFFSPTRYWLAQDVLHAVSKLGLFVGSSSEQELQGAEPTDHTWRMSGFQQAAGRRLVEGVAARSAHANALAELYEARLGAEGWRLPRRSGEAPLLRYPVLVRNRRQLLEASRAQRIELGSWFESPLHPVPLASHPLYGYTLGECPEAERRSEQIVNLPLHARVTREEAKRIVELFIRVARPPA